MLRHQLLFNDLFYFQNMVHPTYKATCIVRGLCQDDVEWNNCLQEAAIIALCRQIRRLFATLLVFGQPLDPLDLLRKHLDVMFDDWHSN